MAYMKNDVLNYDLSGSWLIFIALLWTFETFNGSFTLLRKKKAPYLPKKNVDIYNSIGVIIYLTHIFI